MPCIYTVRGISGLGVTFSHLRKGTELRRPKPAANLFAGSWRRAAGRSTDGTVVDGELVAIDKSGRCNLYPADARWQRTEGEKYETGFHRDLFHMCFAVSSWGEPQKRAPSVAQCRSDAATWNKEEDTGSKYKEVGYQLPFGELLKRQREMMDCMRLDAQHGQDGAVVGVNRLYDRHVCTLPVFPRTQSVDGEVFG
jgi:hypothetical protein